VKPSLEVSSSGTTAAGGFGVDGGSDVEEESVGVLTGTSSSGSDAPSRKSALPYNGAFYSSTWIPSGGTGSSPLFVILTGCVGLSPGALGTSSIFCTIS